MKIIVPADAPPNERALHAPVESDDDLDEILKTLRWIASRRETVENTLKQVIELKRAEARAELKIELQGELYTFDEVEAAMLQQVSDYAKANTERMFAKKRTFPLPHGNVQLRKKRDSIELADGFTEAEVLELVGSDERFVRTKREIDRPHIMAQLDRNELNKQQLADAGLRYVVGGDEVKVG